jgi:hypothetical protein
VNGGTTTKPLRLAIKILNPTHIGLIWNDLSSQLDLRTIPKAASKAVEAAIATVDHSDIRGSGTA